MFSLTGRELLRVSCVGRNVELHLTGGETIRGILQKIHTDRIFITERSGLEVPVLLANIDRASFDVGSGMLHTNRSSALKFQRRCNHLADNAGLVLSRRFRDEFIDYGERCGDGYLRDYVNAEVQQTAASYSPEDVKGCLEAFLRERDARGKDVKKCDTLYAAILFRLRKYDEAVASFLRMTDTEEIETLSVKLACLYSQMSNYFAVLFWLDQYYARVPAPDMSLDNAWWQYLRLCSRFGYYETLRERLRKAAQGSPKTAIESLAYLLLTGGSYAFGVQLLDLAGGACSAQDAMQAVDTYCGFLQPDFDNNYHRYMKCVDSILGSGELNIYDDMEFIAGYIYDYIPDRGYGFIVGFDLVSYFFRIESADSENVLTRIKNNICSFMPVKDEELVLVNYHRTLEAKRSYSAVQII